MSGIVPECSSRIDSGDVLEYTGIGQGNGAGFYVLVAFFFAAKLFGAALFGVELGQALLARRVARVGLLEQLDERRVVEVVRAAERARRPSRSPPSRST